MEPKWVSEQSARYIHAQFMDEHGGHYGPSHEGALEAALARPRHPYHYSPEQRPSLERLAAAYGFAIARGHCFPDGNKRLALGVIDVFLQLNGRELAAAEAEAVVTIRAVAAGEMDEEELAAWISANSASLAD
jgi:death-on-curing protein